MTPAEAKNQARPAADGAGRLSSLGLGLGVKTALQMFAASLLLAIVAAGFEVWNSYRSELARLESQIIEIRETRIAPLTLALWNYDQAQLDLLLQGIANQPFVAAVELLVPPQAGAAPRLRARLGSTTGRRLRIHHLPLLHAQDGRHINLGSLRVMHDLDSVRDTALDRARYILLSQVFAHLLLSLFLVLIVHYGITRHLSALTLALRDARPGDGRITLPLRPRRQPPGDEIDQVVSALGLLHDKLALAYRELETSHAELQADITARLRAEARADHLAHHDPLTQLPNRRLLFQRLDHELAVAKRSNSRGAVLFLDLDHFKAINDTRGHAIGDQILIKVAQRLREQLREIDFVARVAGDEFIAILPILGELQERAAQNAHACAEKLRAAIAQPIQIGEEGHLLSASIGIALYPVNGGNAEDLVKHADAAMHQAKTEGRNSIQFFRPELLSVVEDRQNLELDLREALSRDGLEVVYQPLVDGEGRMRGAEALVRWTHPTRGPVSPAQFIPICEESGLIVALGDWMLRAVLGQIRDWRHSGRIDSEQYVGINISPRQFRHPEFEERLFAALHEHEVPPSMLALEITEGVALEDLDYAIHRMRGLRERGLRLYIDDFGTGYSSLTYLKRLPLDGLKIDKSFVHDLDRNANDGAIVDAILAIGRHFGLAVVAEGVETAAQAEYLVAHRCALMQGYHFGRPMDAGRFADTFLRPSSSA